jgi:hypothetical protein
VKMITTTTSTSITIMVMTTKCDIKVYNNNIIL